MRNLNRRPFRSRQLRDETINAREREREEELGVGYSDAFSRLSSKAPRELVTIKHSTSQTYLCLVILNCLH